MCNKGQSMKIRPKINSKSKKKIFLYVILIKCAFEHEVTVIICKQLLVGK